MPDYIDLGLTADADQLRQDGRDWLEDNAPDGYTLDAFVDWLLGAVARMASEVVVLAGQLPALELFRTFGEQVLGIAAINATVATGTITVTAVNTAGYTLPAGAQIDIDGVGFETTLDLTIPPASSTGTVQVQAVLEGADSSGLTGATVSLISPTLIWVDSVALTGGVTTSGQDAESDQDYVNRLADELPALSPKAILAIDFETIARADTEVARAMAIDNYVPPVPGPEASGVAGAITVAVQADGGANVSTGGKSRVQATLQNGRVLNLAVYVIDPTSTPIDVTFTATAYDGYDATAVRDAAVAAITSYLSAAGWGVPPGGDTSQWIDEPTVRRNDLMGVLYRVEGIRHVTALTLGRARTVTIAASTDTATLTAHGFSNGDQIIFSGLTGGAPLANGTVYYARDVATNTFKITATSGGAAIDITTDATAGKVSKIDTADITLTGPAGVPAANAIAGTVT